MQNFEDTKGVIRNRNSKDRPYNGKQKKDNLNGRHSATQKTKD